MELGEDRRSGGRLSVLWTVLEFHDMGIRKLLAAIWRGGWFCDPQDIGVEEGSLIPGPENGPGHGRRSMMIFPDHARLPWAVPKADSNLSGPSRAEQLYPKLIGYEWDVLFDLAKLEPPSGAKIISGAAYNECWDFLQSAGAMNYGGRVSDLGHQLIAMKQADQLKRSDVV